MKPPLIGAGPQVECKCGEGNSDYIAQASPPECDGAHNTLQNCRTAEWKALADNPIK
jgi:hypothetical protein